MKFIIGKKVSMTQVWQGDKVIGVTQVKADPCTVVQIKNIEKDGYKAVQLGFDNKKEKNIAKPQKGHLKDLPNHRYLKEFRLDGKENIELKRGDKIDVNTFTVGDTIKVTGTSKGKGFQGVVKRHGFHGQDRTHGHKDQERMSGSIGAGGVQHVFKGRRMGGRTGGERVTTTNLEIIEIDPINNILSIKGSVPGARNGLVLVYGEGELKIAVAKEPVVEEVAEVAKEEVVASETATVEVEPVVEIAETTKE